VNTIAPHNKAQNVTQHLIIGLKDMCWTQEIKSHHYQKIREGTTHSVNPLAYTYRVDPHGKDQIYPKMSPNI